MKTILFCLGATAFLALYFMLKDIFRSKETQPLLIDEMKSFDEKRGLR